MRAYRKVYLDCIGTSRTPSGNNIFYLDLLSPDIAPLCLHEMGYKEALIFAARTKIVECEENKEQTRLVNVTGTLELIRRLVQEGVKPIFASSDNVFDGMTGNYDDDALRNPITEYGRQKTEVEDKIDDITRGNHLVIRLGKVFSLEKGDGTLLDEMAKILASGGTVRAAYDQIFNPVLVSDVIKAVSILQTSGATGTVNVCSPEVWTRYNIALEMAKAIKVDRSRVIRISIDEIGPRRPKNASMLTERLSREAHCNFVPLVKCIEQVARNWMDSRQ